MTETQRDRQATEEKLIAAFDSILKEEGFKHLGINAIARRAGVSKVLIYRYFGDFNGLLEVYLQKRAYWIQQQQSIADAIQSEQRKELLSGSVRVMEGLAGQLFSDPAQQELARWSLLENNEVLDRISERMEEPTAERNRQMASRLDIPEKDIRSVIALLIGGINYLILRSATAPLFNDIDIRSESGLEDIRHGIRLIINRCFSKERS